ncbi:chloramphenicol-sensitive protein RarD [Natronospira proteinivora]|uniref:Chloramphenicol-sensitive protein RarD n=1 Tax=Natronospira proteinivora TaxID=1807133 RepID=A0ABT1G678_9GAMM|nr:EamA family transporter RarD [Natronospira proteinivora]MCP1726766.1 chloramphenicol-sensitive protein RarD [Natronospira proteinivora]
MFRDHNERIGVFFATATFCFYGLTPLYFKAVQHVPALEVLGHRIFWSVLFLVGLLWWWGGSRAAARSLMSWKVLPWLFLSGAIIGFNWGVFIWTVHADRVLEASLGYYINPLVNVLLGLLFFGERLRWPQWVGVTLAAAGTVNMVVAQGVLPWAGLALAFSFGFYGLVRKKVAVKASIGLLVETAMLLPLVLLAAAWAWQADMLSFAHGDLKTDLLLISAGVITTLPLIWFANAARRLPLSVIGFFQYIAPTVTLCLAVFLFGEDFTPAHGVTFALIWIALALLMADTIRYRRLSRSSLERKD